MAVCNSFVVLWGKACIPQHYVLHRHQISACANIFDVYRELVKSVAPEGPVMVTWANLHYLDFVLNWVDHVRACGIKAFLVGAMDDRILQVGRNC